MCSQCGNKFAYDAKSQSISLPAPKPESAPIAKPKSRRWLLALMALACLACAIAYYAINLYRHPMPESAKDTRLTIPEPAQPPVPETPDNAGSRGRLQEIQRELKSLAD